MCTNKKGRNSGDRATPNKSSERHPKLPIVTGQCSQALGLIGAAMRVCSDPLAEAFAEDLFVLARNAKEVADYLATRMEEISPKHKHGAGRDVLRDWHAWLELSEIAASMSGGAK